jgi:adenine-specific DNA-methyltransferase
VYAKNQAALPTAWRGQMAATKEAMVEEFRRLQGQCGTDLPHLQKRWTAFMTEHKDEMPRGLVKMTQTSLESPFEPDTDLGNPHPGGGTYDVLHPNGKSVKQPMRGWRYSKEAMDRLLAGDLIAFGKDETKIPRKKKRLLDDLTGKLPSIINDFTVNNDITRLFPEAQSVLFPYPKPSELEEYLLSFVADKDALILDPFGGSGTTAHAVMRLNKKDDGDRRFIIIERGNLANNDEYAVELTSERIRRARTVDGLPGGLTFLRVGEEINDDAWAKMQRDEVAGVIRQSDPAGKGRGLRKVDGRYVVGASSRKQAVCLHWGGGDGGAVSRDVLRGMFEEVAELGLKLPMRVYGITCDVAETDDFTFHQLPFEVEVLLGHGPSDGAA